MNRRRMAAAAALLVVLGLAVTTAAPVNQEEAQRLHPDRIEQLTQKRSFSSVGAAQVDPALLHSNKGTHEVVVRLKSPSAAEHTDAERRQLHKAVLQEEQSAFLKRIGLLSNEISRVQTVLNAVFLTIDASQVASLAQDPDVVSIRRVSNYQMHLDETVPYIGSDEVQDQGYSGDGIKVAVLDSGIDYTHAAFGGKGTVEAFEEAYLDNVNRDDLFPTEKVVEGIDFVGESWPGGDIAPDDDPIDGQGHGTAVADIINSVAPGVSLYAVRVCARLAQSCYGRALMQGLEWAIEQGVDIINLSIGTPYGTPFDHDLSQAINAASKLGVLVVASAGNSGDKPYIVATGGSAASALSVAQTQVPSASLQLLQADGVDYHAVFMPWSEPLEGVITGPVQYGDGQGGNLDGCAPFDSGSLAGKVVLVDRGMCNFSLKISHATQGGGLACIVGRIAAGDPFPGGDGGDRPIGVPGYMVSKSDADSIRAPGTIATLDPNNRRPLIKTMTPSSSRGPQHEDKTLIKPEIGAPGSSIAAVAGTGSETAPFGGTSGAAPMIAGSAALMLEKFPSLEPHEVKARLMNNCETGIKIDPFKDLAPITRIGGGEVRADRALSARAAAWDKVTLQGALSFGFLDVFGTSTVYKWIRIRNYSNDDITFTITPTFRYAEDQASGAVTISPMFPVRQVKAGSYSDVPIILTVKGDRLDGNYMSSGEEGGSGDALTKNEFDGYIILDDGVQPMNLPWHILPRKAANVSVKEENDASYVLSNVGAGEAQIEAFSLVALSEDIPEGNAGEGLPMPDIRAVGVRTRTNAGSDVCSDTNAFVWDFAISTWERQQHLAAIAAKIFIDVDQDGTDDFLVLNNDISGSTFAIDGRQVVYALDVNTGNFSSSFFVDHSMNTGNIVLSVCAEQLGLDESDLFETNVNMEFYTQDILYSGEGDEVLNITVTPGAERFAAVTGDIRARQTETVTVLDAGAFVGNSEELGLMIITNADRGEGNRGGATQASEVLLLEM